MKITSKALSRDQAVFIVLCVLKDGPRHGYDIAREVERRSGSTIHFNDGTLYPILHALEEDSCIESQWDLASERPRRMYEINEKGLAELDRRIAAWQVFSQSVNQILAGKTQKLVASLLAIGGGPV